jgi:hypothetical protein
MRAICLKMATKGFLHVLIYRVYSRPYYWGHGKLGRCVIQLSKFLNHTLATHNQVDSFFENINYNDGKGAFTLTFFEMTITDWPGFHVPHCTSFLF